MANVVWNPTIGNNASVDANWVGGTKPGAGDVAYFDATSTADCTIDADPACAGVYCTAAYTGTITQAADITITLGASGWETYKGTFVGSNAAISITGIFYFASTSFTSTSGTLTVAGKFTLGSVLGPFVHNSGTVVLTGAAKYLGRYMVGSGGDFFNLQVSGTYSCSQSDGILGIQGTLTVDAGKSIAGFASFYMRAGSKLVNAGTITCTNIRYYDSCIEDNTFVSGAGTNNTTWTPVISVGVFTRTVYNGAWMAAHSVYCTNEAAADAAVFELPNEVIAWGEIGSYNGYAAGTPGITINFNSAVLSGCNITFRSTSTQNIKFDAESATGTIGNITGRSDSTGNSVFDINAAVLTATGNVDYTGVGAGSESIVNTGGGTLTFSKASAHSIDVGGGTFNDTTGTVVFAGAGAITLVAGMTFTNKTFGASKTHNYGAGQTFVETGTLASNGAHGATASVIRSTINGTQYAWTHTGVSLLSDKIDIRDCDASSGNKIPAHGSVGASQNNINFDFGGGFSLFQRDLMEKRRMKVWA